MESKEPQAPSSSSVLQSQSTSNPAATMESKEPQALSSSSVPAASEAKKDETAPTVRGLISFGADEKGDAEILVQPNANKETQDAYGQYCGIPAPQRYGFLSKAKQGRQLAPALVDGRNSREEEESSGAFRRVVATPGPQRVLARTASCPADMSPEGTERFENTCRLQELRRGELCLPWPGAAAALKPQAPSKRLAATPVWDSTKVNSQPQRQPQAQQ